MLLLGPMPEAVRAVVQHLVADGQNLPGCIEDHPVFMLAGGPGGASYLDADGEVWNCWYDFDGSGEEIQRVPDGPMKVGLVAIAAERVPGLAAWLPVRPPHASDCADCRGSGWMLPPLQEVLCPMCRGMGWVQFSKIG